MTAVTPNVPKQQIKPIKNLFDNFFAKTLAEISHILNKESEKILRYNRKNIFVKFFPTSPGTSRSIFIYCHQMYKKIFYHINTITMLGNFGRCLSDIVSPYVHTYLSLPPRAQFVTHEINGAPCFSSFSTMAASPEEQT